MTTVLKSPTESNLYTRVIEAVEYEWARGKDIRLKVIMEQGGKYIFKMTSMDKEVAKWLPHFAACLVSPLKRDCGEGYTVSMGTTGRRYHQHSTTIWIKPLKSAKKTEKPEEQVAQPDPVKQEEPKKEVQSDNTQKSIWGGV